MKGTVPKFTLAQTKSFLAKWRAAGGGPIGLYMSESGFYNAGQDLDWVAHYGVAEPSRHWDFHQYTSTYNGGHLDANHFHGTLDALRNIAKGDTVPTINLLKHQRWTANGANGALRAEPVRNGAVTDHVPAGEEIISWGEYQPGDGNNWRVAEWGGKVVWFLRSGVGVPNDHDFIPGADVPFPQPVTDCTAAVQQAVTAQKNTDALALASAIDKAAIDERERIALAEASRIRNT